MKRGPKKREHKKDFTALYPSEYRKFFSLVGLYGYARTLQAWDKESRIAAWRDVVREVKIESGMNNQDLAVVLNRTKNELAQLFTRQTEEPPFGFVLDVCFIFDIDPLRVYPELAWMRDLWMEDFKVHLNVAQTALEQGQTGVLREALQALKKGAAAWENPQLEAPMTKLLLVTKGEYTQRYAEARQKQRMRSSKNRRYPEEIVQDLMDELTETVELRRRPYEQSTKARIKAKKG